MYTNRHKSWFHQLVVVILAVVVSGVGFSARNRSEERGRGQQQSEQKAAAASQKSESPAKAQPRSSEASSNRSQERQRPADSKASQQRQQTAPAPARQSAPARNDDDRSVQPARSTRPAPSAPQAQPNRSVERQTAQQTPSQPTQQRSKAVPARRVNRTVEVVSTAERNNSSSNRVNVSTRTSSVSSAENAKPKTSSVSRTVITPLVAVKTQASVETRTERKPMIETVSSPKAPIARPQPASRTAGKISTRLTAPATSKEPERTVNRTSVKKSGTSFEVFGSDSERKSRQTASITAQTKTRDRNIREKTVTPLRVTVNDIKTQPAQVTVSDRSSRGGSTPRPFDGRHDRQRRSEPSSTIVINNDNRVIVQGSPTRQRPRPNFSRRLFSDTRYIRKDPHWLHYGSGFYFSWSSSSCGVVVSLPYYYTTVHYGTPYYGLSYYYPNYHRKYVFVSIGGYWPYDYRYRRYYWYGCHPYYWYGANVIYEPSRNVTNNTYNYYYDTDDKADTAGYGFSSSAQPYYTLGNPKEEVVDEPQFETAADLCFDHAVTLFAAGNYADAVEQFREAVLLSPDDIILPFTYSQALFASGDYARAAGVLRGALDKIPEDELTIYFPRGLYEDEKVINDQIEQLEIAAEKEPFAADYQLLLGYQYLGMGKLEKVHLPLTKAAQSSANAEAAGKLMALAAQLEKENES